MFSSNNKKEEDYNSIIFEDLSNNQKMSLLNLLFFLARCDGEVNKQPNEVKFLSSYFALFRIHLGTCEEYMELGGTDTMMRELVPLTKKQKEHLLVISFDLICCDGKPNETEINTLLYCFEKIGIVEDECVKIIQKAMLLAKYIDLK